MVVSPSRRHVMSLGTLSGLSADRGWAPRPSRPATSGTRDVRLRSGSRSGGHARHAGESCPRQAEASWAGPRSLSQESAMRRSRIVMGTAAGLLLVGGGAAIGVAAAAPTDSSGVIHGCWTDKAVNGSHTFALQDAGTSCPKGSTAITWNQTGPAGATGATGAQGAQGAQGPAAPPGPAGPS